MVAEVVTTLLNLWLIYTTLGCTNMPDWQQVAIVLVTLVSGALGGWLVKALARCGKNRRLVWLCDCTERERDHQSGTRKALVPVCGPI
jgi:hypothetical protein